MSEYADPSLELAEAHLVGRALTDEGWLEELLASLKIGSDNLPDLRSRDCEVLKRILYIVAAWSEDGSYNASDNELRLLSYGRVLGLDEGLADFLEDLYSPMMALEQYRATLVERVLQCHYLQDAAYGSTLNLITGSPFPASDNLEELVYERLRGIVIARRADRYNATSIPTATKEKNSDVRFRFDS